MSSLSRTGMMSLLVIALSCVPGPPGPAGDDHPDGNPLIELRLAATERAADRTRVEVDGATLYLHPTPVLSDPDIMAARARATRDPDGPLLLLDLRIKRAAGARLQETMQNAIGTRMAMLFNSAVVAAPVIRTPVGADTAMQLQMRVADPALAVELVRARWPESHQSH